MLISKFVGVFSRMPYYWRIRSLSPLPSGIWRGEVQTLENQHLFLFSRELRDWSRKYHFSTPPRLLPGGRGKEFFSFNKASYLTLQKYGSVHSTTSVTRGREKEFLSILFGILLNTTPRLEINIFFLFSRDLKWGKSSYPSIRHPTKHSNTIENQHIFYSQGN